ncbi:CRISPR-associated protein Csx16 [Mannheimia sp. ZY171111]|uniref:CRISPR-associated protein Csx16 n=1 Tax=Mannheimia sp. ZY171111 TaxID=2679995 RepID=UPI001ADDA07B|nr:CRISPR-associated protein Csx16 [Mannheimia sp. ZY171111]QTM01032.1 CRISPR-associated protein Csx16 [Mannheimia sp. ZY171111]
MITWFVSRHIGAIEWIKQQPIHIDRFVEHLNVANIQADDIVIGTLPIHLAAEVCQKGAKFYFLSVNVARYQRGTELTCEQLVEQGCSLQPFYIEKL